jgi:type IV pilus assembly protein PilQ
MKWMTKTSMILALAFCVAAGNAMLVPYRALAAQDGINPLTGKLAEIKSISVAGEGAATDLVIMLSSPAAYTSYKSTAPLRLVIDLSQTTVGNVTSPQAINRGNFKTVTATRFDTDAGVLTRIAVDLVTDAEAVITASPLKPGELRISFPSLAAKPIMATQQPSVQNQSATPSAPSQLTTSTRKLTSVSVNADKILLAVDGGIADFNTFRLNNPERFVIDLMDTQLDMTSRLVPLNAVGVASARIGLYPEKVRVVLDSVSGSFPEASASKTSQGLAVTLFNKNGTTIAATQPVQAQPLAATSASSGFGPASVETIDFQVVNGISRVAVKVKGNVSFDPPVKSPGFVTLNIKNAGLSKQLQRSFETQSFASPVLRITPLLVRTSKGTDTKIRIAMREVAPYEFRQEGDMLFVDFKNPEGSPADKTSPRSAKHTDTYGSVKDNELASALSPVPDPSTKSPGYVRTYKGKKVTLEFADAEVRKIFQLLSEVSNKNFVLGDDVTGTISIKLVNVPWDQALDIILDTKNLDKREDGNIIIIKGKGKFKSQYEEEQELKKVQLRGEPLITEYFPVNYSSVASVKTQVDSLLTPTIGKSYADDRTNTLIVTSVKADIDHVKELLRRLDVPEKQVMIEARIVEASSAFTKSFGISWGIHANDPTVGYIMGVKQFNMGFGGLASTPPPTTGVSGQPGGTMGISFGSIFGTDVNLDMRLNAAASAGLIKIVSTPKVATLNNKSAKITQGQQIPYTSSTSDKVETKFVEAALSLEVTPHINANGTIGLKIDAKNDSVGQATGGSTAPAINKKQATTEMLLRDGETTVIGGIFVDSDNDSESGVPWLMDIPLLGKLFKSSQRTKVKTELLIFITPRIINPI